MGLKIKTMKEALIGMADWVANNSKRLVDFSPGSVVRTILEAVATELEEYYFKSYKNFIWAVENAVYESFNFKQREAIPSFGDIQLNFNNPLLSEVIIKSGTRFGTTKNFEEELFFVTKQDYIVKAGSTHALIEVHCEKAGKIGNVPADSIVLMTNSVSFISTITNPERFITGRDKETLAERKQRFTKYIETRQKATISALEYGTLEVDGVTGAFVDETKTGIVRIYAHDAAGNLSETLKQKIIDNLYYYRAGGIPVYVMPIRKVSLNVELEITVLSKFNTPEFKMLIEDNVRNYFDDFVVSQDVITSDLNTFVRRLDDMAIKNCKIKNPALDLEVAQSELIRSGNVVVNLVSY